VFKGIGNHECLVMIAAAAAFWFFRTNDGKSFKRSSHDRMQFGASPSRRWLVRQDSTRLI